MVLGALVGALAPLAACGGVLALDGIAPAVAGPGDTVTLLGRGFDPAMRARLVSPAGATVVLGLAAVEPTRAQATLPAATPAGLWGVTIDHDGLSHTLPAAVTVQAGALIVRFLDVGQGDATLVTGPDGSSLLIDGGSRDAGPIVGAAVRDFAGGRLDAVALTHTDADHLGGLVDVLRGDDGVAGSVDDVVPARRWIGHPDSLCDTQLCAEFRALRARFDEPLVGDTLDLGGATVSVVGRDGDFGAGAGAGVDEENERSLALVISFAGRRVFVGGDLTGGGLGSADVEAEAARATGPVDVLRLNHHGSSTSSSAGFLGALQPAAVVVSVGTDNAFCHPARDVLERLASLGAPVWATGAGMVVEGGRCDDGATVWPAGARPGRGAVTLVVGADGSITLDDTPL
ncbi:MAG: MBL fold metallo-hydrolase [Deltaproteobacteria bacterium]|nr:MBL fold metallo-hydrolase [Deltaproteobacteria bacterium]